MPAYLALKSTLNSTGIIAVLKNTFYDRADSSGWRADVNKQFLCRSEGKMQSWGRDSFRVLFSNSNALHHIPFFII